MVRQTLSETPVTSPHIKTGQYLEWITDLSDAQDDTYRISPVFFLKSNKCYFLFVENGWPWKSPPKYEIYLEFQNNRRDLDRSRVHFQVGFEDEETLSLHKGEFDISENLPFWSITDSELQPKLHRNSKMKFHFYFDNLPLLKFNEEIGGTSVQTPKYMDSSFLLESVSKDLSKMFDEGTDQDVEFICGNEIIKAHKNILCSRSDVFATKFRSDMVESKTGQVNIEDMEGSILRQFLRYLYTGVFPELTVDVAFLFYKAADKYAVDALKAQCISFLTENLSPENACDVLIFTDRHGEPDFKKNVMEYVIKEEIQFMKEKWTTFCMENPTLASEVFNLFCRNVQRNKDRSKDEQCANSS